MKKAVVILVRLQVVTTFADVMIVSKHVVNAAASHGGNAARDVVIVWVKQVNVCVKHA